MTEDIPISKRITQRTQSLKLAPEQVWYGKCNQETRSALGTAIGCLPCTRDT
jgi:hypothetical protein